MALIKKWQNWAITSDDKKLNLYKYTKYLVICQIFLKKFSFVKIQKKIVRNTIVLNTALCAKLL